jgi:hypothetical protein
MRRFAQHFATRAATADPAAPSVSNWNGVRDLLAEESGFTSKEVYVSTISKPGNITVRFNQSEAARTASLLVAMYTGPSQLERAVERLFDMVARRGCRGVVAAYEGDNWKIVALLVQGVEDPLVEAITSTFPDAVVLTA